METLFSREHIWIELDNDTAKIGITDYAQEKLGDILFINLPDSEEALIIGDVFGDIESVKTVSDLISPVKGKVITVNEELLDEPDVINEDADNAWLIEVEVDEIATELMSEIEYKEYLEAL